MGPRKALKAGPGPAYHRSLSHAALSKRNPNSNAASLSYIYIHRDPLLFFTSSRLPQNKALARPLAFFSLPEIEARCRAALSSASSYKSPVEPTLSPTCAPSQNPTRQHSAFRPLLPICSACCNHQAAAPHPVDLPLPQTPCQPSDSPNLQSSCKVLG